jgi:hypothetical protein
MYLIFIFKDQKHDISKRNFYAYIVMRFLDLYQSTALVELIRNMLSIFQANF